MEVSGNPVPVLEGVGVKASGAANFDVADDGRLIYLGGGGLAAPRVITWTSRTGKETPITAAPVRNYYYARVSPDGRFLSLDIRDEEQDVWIWDLRREQLARLTDKAGADQYGLWMPNGEGIVFNSMPGGRGNSTGCALMAPARLSN